MGTKITLRPEIAGDASQDVVLADGADRADDNVRGPATGSINVSIASQPIQAIRADNAKFKGKGNRSGSYSFEASRRFAGMPDAGRFHLTHGMTCPASGTLIFDFGDTEATPTPGNLVALLGCVITQIGTPRQIGIHISTNYSVQFGMAIEVSPAELQATINDYYGYVPERLINCGGEESGDFEADAEYDDETDIGATEEDITGYGTVPEAVYQTYRYGEFSYAIPLPAGTYDIKLHFAEPLATAAEEREFNVSIDGEVELEDYDIYTEAGGAKETAVVETFSAVAFAGGELIIAATAVTGDPLICGIEITPHIEAAE